jgi:hypothetical protein
MREDIAEVQIERCKDSLQYAYPIAGILSQLHDTLVPEGMGQYVRQSWQSQTFDPKSRNGLTIPQNWTFI